MAVARRAERVYLARLGPASLLLALPALVFVATNRWPGWAGGISRLREGDVESYLPMAAAAPHLPPVRIGSAYTERFLVHYGIGLLARLPGLDLQSAYALVCALVLVAVVAVLLATLARLDLPAGAATVVVSWLVLNPYAFRYYAVVPAMVADVVSPGPGFRLVEPRRRPGRCARRWRAARRARAGGGHPVTAPPREGGFGRLAGRLVLAVLLLAALARLLGAECVPIAVWAAALTPLLYLPAYPLAYLAARARAWPRLALALALVVAHLCWLAPVLLPAPPPVRPADRGQPLRLLTANLFQHNHRIDEMIAAVRAAEWCSSQLTVRSTTQRWRPSRSGDALLAPVRAATLTIR